ncbi:hypothetical protein MRX96_044059 [Rhipicephalus microplus]
MSGVRYRHKEAMGKKKMEEESMRRKDECQRRAMMTEWVALKEDSFSRCPAETGKHARCRVRPTLRRFNPRCTDTTPGVYLRPVPHGGTRASFPAAFGEVSFSSGNKRWSYVLVPV